MNTLKIENAKAEPKKKEQGAESNACQNQQQDCAPYLNLDILVEIIKTTLDKLPQMRQTLRAVSRFLSARG